MPAADTQDVATHHQRLDACFDDIAVVAGAMHGRLLAWGVDAGTANDVVLAVSEALNNVVEHGYRGLGGRIDLTAVLSAGRLRVRIRDEGRENRAFAGLGRTKPDTDGPRQDLPEGGFGWFLIRQIAASVRYRRIGGANLLTLDFSA